MYTRILVPVDGSEFAEQMIPHASAIAKATGAGLALLRIVSDPVDQAGAREQVERLASGIGGEGLCVVARGEVADAIRTEADRVPGTLVALTSHGRSGAAEAIFGSVALEVLRELRGPLLVYRPHAKAADAGAPKIGRVVLPLDGSPESESMVPQAAEFAKWLGARVLVVSVLDPRQRIDAGIPAGDVQESSYVHGRAQDSSRPRAGHRAALRRGHQLGDAARRPQGGDPAVRSQPRRRDAGHGHARPQRAEDRGRRQRDRAVPARQRRAGAHPHPLSRLPPERAGFPGALCVQVSKGRPT